METKNKNMEASILAAASRLFAERGYNATSTTDIAREVGCNQALVHYYFRTKENLFQKVFISKFESIVGRLRVPLDEGCDFFPLLRTIVDTYFDIIAEAPQTVHLFLNELVLDTERRESIKAVFMENMAREDFFRRFCQAAETAMQHGQIRKVEPLHLYVDIVSLVIFSHLSASVLGDLMGMDAQATGAYLAQRREETYTLLVQGLAKKQDA